ncbi:MAG: energy transducer TonB [Gammaproteobacteria bacterium]
MRRLITALFTFSLIVVGFQFSGCSTKPNISTKKVTAGKDCTAKMDYCPLRPIREVAPGYPPRAVSVEGVVTVCFTVKKNGTVANARVVYTSFHPKGYITAQNDLKAAALIVIQQWKFEPERINGHAVNRPGVCQDFDFQVP